MKLDLQSSNRAVNLTGIILEWRLMEVAVLDELVVSLPQLLQALTQRVQAKFEIRILICQFGRDRFMKGIAKTTRAPSRARFRR